MTGFFIDPATVLDQLKPFQQRTARHAYDRLVNGSSGRFLVADEVGLGKTLVARAVVAHMIEHLAQQRTARIDVVYVCSNLAIARQNLRKLNPTAQKEHEHRVRLTMLPVEMGALQDGTPDQPALNFIALTPQTSLDMGSRTGSWRERALMHWLVTKLYPDLAGRRGLLRAFGVGLHGSLNEVGKKARARFTEFRADHQLTPGYFDHFVDAVADADADGPADSALADQLWRVDEGYDDARRVIPWEMHELRKQMVGQLRQLVAGTAVSLLEPDLVILDEFQRFKNLLQDPEANPVAELAQAMMSFTDTHTGNRAKVLLLSATPYKALSLRSDEEQSDHYDDLLETVAFLADDDQATARANQGFQRLHQAMLGLRGGGVGAAADACQTLAGELRQLMARTERLAVTPDRDGMLTTTKPGVEVDRADVRGYLAQAAVSSHVGSYEVVELWKSAPWLLSFMENYALKEAVTDRAGEDDALSALLASDEVSVPSHMVERFEELGPPNGRYRALRDRVFGGGTWQLAWLPPALPYYRTDGPFDSAKARAFTKHLVFSSWSVVPKAVSTLLSYDAELRMRRPESVARGYSAVPHQNLQLRLDEKSEPRGMSTLALFMPSPALASLGDPLAATRQWDGEVPTVETVRQAVRQVVADALSTLPTGSEGGPEDTAWYVLAPLLLDRQRHPEATQAWIDQQSGWGQAWAGEGEGEGRTQLRTHLDRVTKLLNGQVQLGRQPSDLVEVLADLALAAPGNVVLRALTRTTQAEDINSREVWNSAARIAWSFRSLFNGPELQDLIADMHGQPYWRGVLTYCLEGHLQAVMDEYVHTFADWRGFVTQDRGTLREELVGVLDDVLTLRTTTHVVHTWDQVNGKGVRRDPDPRMRAHFAVPFATRTVIDEQGLQRTTAVSEAFNSPFWPFVVVSTSIGQEGLDFHLYAHAVVHWNLPSNPVDLEQREGRVHRYKGHAVRKNVAACYGASVLGNGQAADVWSGLFARAAEDGDADGLSPWWVFPGEATIQRVLLLPPLSREQGRYAGLERALGRYRLALGSPRQDEFLAYLNGLDADTAAEASRLLRVDLSPPV